MLLVAKDQELTKGSMKCSARRPQQYVTISLPFSLVDFLKDIQPGKRVRPVAAQISVSKINFTE